MSRKLTGYRANQAKRRASQRRQAIALNVALGLAYASGAGHDRFRFDALGVRPC